MSVKFPSLPNVRLLVKRVFPTPRPVAPSDPLARLQAAADGGDEAAFLSAQRMIDWTNRPPEDFVRAVRLALQAGAYSLAETLAQQGAERYPDHIPLQKFARVLAPPKVIRTGLPPDPTLKADRDWFVAHAAEYRGQWIAIKNGMLLASALTVRELKRKVPNLREATLAHVV